MTAFTEMTSSGDTQGNAGGAGEGTPLQPPMIWQEITEKAEADSSEGCGAKGQGAGSKAAERLSQLVWLSTATDFPGRFWNLHPLRFLKLS